jgi:hypothetical protein
MSGLRVCRGIWMTTYVDPTTGRIVLTVRHKA